MPRSKKVYETSAIRVYPQRDKDGYIWWLIHAPERLNIKGPIYVYQEWKLLRVITELSDKLRPFEAKIPK